jgi:hypothetical protein
MVISVHDVDHRQSAMWIWPRRTGSDASHSLALLVGISMFEHLLAAPCDRIEWQANRLISVRRQNLRCNRSIRRALPRGGDNI